MAHKVGNVVLVSVTNPGTGSLVLPSTAQTGRVHPSFWLAASDTTFYRIEAKDGSAWEEGIGTYSATGNGQISRDTVLHTSAGAGSSSKINFTGETWVYLELPQQKRMMRDQEDIITDGAGNAATWQGVRDLGTITSGTVTPATKTLGGPFQKYTNNGAHTLAADSNNGIIAVEITNGASAGTITLSGFDDVLGDSFDTTNANVFECIIFITDAAASIQVRAHEGNT